MNPPHLPRQAMWFFLAAPPILARLFDPHCLNTFDHLMRAWLVVTLYTALTGVLVHHTFGWMETRLSGRSMGLRLLAHSLAVPLEVGLATFLQFWYVRWIYPEVGNDVAGVMWRAIVVAYAYLAVAGFMAHLQNQAVSERLRAQHERTAALEARLAMLQSQLQPHFLFNSLNLCAGLVHSAPDAAEATIDKLSGFLRYTLESSNTALVPLARELEAVAAYLDIQHERFGDKLRHEVETNGLLADAPKVPPMLLQPLIENAIVHGIAGESGGVVRIVCRRESDRFIIAVEDSGGGGAKKTGTGLGQHNVRERLRLVYGERAELVCAPLGGGYSSVISLPTTEINP